MSLTLDRLNLIRKSKRLPGNSATFLSNFGEVIDFLQGKDVERDVIFAITTWEDDEIVLPVKTAMLPLFVTHFPVENDSVMVISANIIDPEWSQKRFMYAVIFALC